MLEQQFLTNDLIPEVALEFMNAVHYEELELVNKLLGLLSESSDNIDISLQMQVWVDHTDAHFAREEKVMQEYHFPPFPVHKMEHDTVLQQLKDVQSQWLASFDKAQLENYIKNTWGPWLQGHIGSMDMVTAQYLSQFDIQVKI